MVAMTTTYQAVCWRDEAGWWIIELPELPGAVSETRRLDQVAETAADAAGVMLDIDPASLSIEVVPQLDPHRNELVARYARDSADAEQARAEAGEAASRVRADVAALLGSGLTAREVAQLLGISPQRVSQLADRRRSAA